MGSGYSLKCRKCGYEFSANLGVGFMFPLAYQETMEAGKAGKLGKEVKRFLEEHPDGVMDCSSVILQCSECGALGCGPDLSMYVPGEDCLAVLNQLAGKKEEHKPQVVFHTDQGAVYSSKAFCQAHKQYNILRSMSRGGTPTDNPIIESLNGWIKDELYLDFDLGHSQNVPELLDKYVYYFNNQRCHAALGYKSPVQYKTELGFL